MLHRLRNRPYLFGGGFAPGFAFGVRTLIVLSSGLIRILAWSAFDLRGWVRGLVSLAPRG